MCNGLPNCWEIMECGREVGGANVSELGTCIASRMSLGHSCWAIAGTLCGGVVEGTAAQDEGTCIVCEVYTQYNRLIGSRGKDVVVQFPDEERKYRALLVARMKNLASA
jgi:hypothetical protein